MKWKAGDGPSKSKSETSVLLFCLLRVVVAAAGRDPDAEDKDNDETCRGWSPYGYYDILTEMHKQECIDIYLSIRGMDEMQFKHRNKKEFESSRRY